MFIFKKDIPTLQRNLDMKRAKTRLDSPMRRRGNRRRSKRIANGLQKTAFHNAIGKLSRRESLPIGI